MMFTLALCILSVHALLVNAQKPLRPRDDQPPLQTLTIPLTLTDDRKYLVGINMSPGPNVQGFHFAVTTGTGYSMVVGDSCDSCDVSVQGYNQSNSTTAQSLNTGQEISLAGASASGNVIQEDCSLNTTISSAPWVYPNQSIIVANQSDSLFSSGMSGVFGLGTNGLENDFNSTVIAGWLQRNPTQSNFSYGMMINGPEDSQSDGGVLHWIAPDVNAYDSANVVWKDMAPMDSSSFNSTGLTYDFYVTMDSWTLTVANTTLTKMNLVTLLDPLLTSTIFPQEEAALIYATVPGAVPVSSTSAGAVTASSSAISNAWSVPCDASLQVAFTFGNLTFVMDETSLVRHENGQCFGTIEEWRLQSATEHLLGSTFIAKMYLMFQISGSAKGAVGFANRKSSGAKNTMSTGAIVGITIGSAAFVGLIVALGAFLFFRRRQKRSDARHERDISTVKEMPGLDPYLLGTEEQYTPGMTSQTTSPRSAPSPYQSVRGQQPVSPYNHTIVVSDSATVDPESPPPYLSNSPTSGNREEGGSVVVTGQYAGPAVMIGPPPEDRKRPRRDM
ncbi:aspartic peptidase domain-containing protein [Mucidula mucida]|nr:aspartic peptidase domain-containing protein [Mucidula mucida]